MNWGGRVSLSNVWVQTLGDGLVRADQVTGIDAHQTPALTGKPSRWLLGAMAGGQVVLARSVSDRSRCGYPWAGVRPTRTGCEQMMTVVTEVTLGAGRGVTSGCSGEVRQRRGRVRDRGERTQRCPCLGTRHGAAIPRRWRRAVAAFGCPPRSAPHRDRSGPARVEGSGDVRPPHDRVDRGVASPEWVEALRIDDLQSSGCHTFSQSSRRFGPGIPSTRHGRRYTCFAG
jgi:hypothetical protein